MNGADRGAPAAGAAELPTWARVGEKRRGHIARVTALLDRWAAAIGLEPGERSAWHDAGLLHDALRDADPGAMAAVSAPDGWSAAMLHGPAAAARAAAAGESRTAVLEAVRWHTVGNPAWDRTGRALYLADFLEPGRAFAAADRAFLAAQVPTSFDGVFRQVVKLRLEWALREGNALYPETVALWNSVR